jgi:predicted enzyme related to lactoylglutathione lyase
MKDPLTDIPNVGRFFVLQDPQGAVISAITYAMSD